MNRFHLAVISIAALVAVALCGFLSTRENTLNSRPPFEAPRMSAEVSPHESTASPITKPPASDERESVSEPTDWSNLRRRLDGMADRLAMIHEQREANRLIQHWLRADRNAALAWLSGHRGDPRFDPIASSVAQTLVAAGDFGEAQKLADGIVDPAVGDWVHQEAWAVAYEQGLVTAEQIQRSGLPPAAVGSVLSGSHRD